MLDIWFPEKKPLPTAFLVDTSEEALLLPDWLKLRMIRSEVPRLVDAGTAVRGDDLGLACCLPGTEGSETRPKEEMAMKGLVFRGTRDRQLQAFESPQRARGLHGNDAEQRRVPAGPEHVASLATAVWLQAGKGTSVTGPPWEAQ